MARKGWSVGRVSEVVGFARSASRGRDERLLVRVLVDSACPRELALAVRDALVPERPSARVEVLPLDAPMPTGELPDVVVALVGPESPMDAVVSHARAGVPAAVVVEGLLEAPGLQFDGVPEGMVGVVAASSPEALSEKLALWLVSACDKHIALAANFPFCRGAVVDLLISRCSFENAIVGAVHLIPGSDLPVMTANQLKLALDIAAAYGCPIEPERALELLGVVGAGLGWRALARTLLGAVPGLGTLLRAGIAFGGTVATGNALRLRFELPSLAERAGESFAPDVAARPSAVLLDAVDASQDGYVTIGGERS